MSQIDALQTILTRLDKLETSLSDIEKRMNRRLDEKLETLEGKYVRADLLEERAKSQGERIGNLESNLQTVLDDRKWLNRAILTAIITSLFSVLVAILPGLVE